MTRLFSDREIQILKKELDGGHTDISIRGDIEASIFYKLLKMIGITGYDDCAPSEVDGKRIGENTLRIIYRDVDAYFAENGERVDAFDTVYIIINFHELGLDARAIDIEVQAKRGKDVIIKNFLAAKVYDTLADRVYYTAVDRDQFLMI